MIEDSVQEAIEQERYSPGKRATDDSLEIDDPELMVIKQIYDNFHLHQLPINSNDLNEFRTKYRRFEG